MYKKNIAYDKKEFSEFLSAFREFVNIEILKNTKMNNNSFVDKIAWRCKIIFFNLLLCKYNKFINNSHLFRISLITIHMIINNYFVHKFCLQKSICLTEKQYLNYLITISFSTLNQ